MGLVPGQGTKIPPCHVVQPLPPKKQYILFSLIDYHKILSTVPCAKE